MIGSTPEASGSNVPACPTFSPPNSRRILPTTCAELIPGGLSTLRKPQKACFCGKEASASGCRLSVQLSVTFSSGNAPGLISLYCSKALGRQPSGCGRMFSPVYLFSSFTAACSHDRLFAWRFRFSERLASWVPAVYSQLPIGGRHRHTAPPLRPPDTA